MKSQVEDLRARLKELPEAWRASFSRRLAGASRASETGRNTARILSMITKDIDVLLSAQVARKERQFVFEYPEDLPISQARKEIAEAIRRHQVVIVCGETGSGKTTQLPKICAELGRGIDGLIGHTQPRRVAARSVSARVANEMGTTIGEGVGYSVRFNDQTDAGTRVKMMTDGILLAETQRDRDLLAYDTIIIDEAHERSLNIDFLLGYLARLLPRRPDLKIVVTSATINPERFSRHFNNAPIIRVEGRSYPVDVQWQPFEGAAEEEGVLSSAIAQAIDVLDETNLGADDPTGLPDVLVFLPGEQEIHEARRRLLGRSFRDTEILPLYAQLPSARQDEVFRPGTKRRIVLATNVAETSLTVPRIRAVVDSGLARISRYSARSRVQRLPIEGISQASAKQRAGRCGRLGPGICIRLYSQEEYEKREEFTQPEIKRANLASVILQMHALRLGRPEEFPFLEKPSLRLIRDGYETLEELGALDRKNVLTEVGRTLAKLPVDPRIGRMILASIEEGCVSEILVIAAAMAVQDPRLRPADERSAADLAHISFRDSSSDFLSFLRMWNSVRRARSEKGSSEFKSWCRRSFLSIPRLLEWESVHRQLREMTKENLPKNQGSNRFLSEPRDHVPSGAVHRSILCGFLSNAGRLRESGDYETPGGGVFEIFPGSVLKKEKPLWVVCAEIVETTRRWGRTLGRIRGEWIERVAPHLVRSECLDPHFVPESGHVAAWERVHYGTLVTTDRRKVPFEPIDPVAAREVFIQEALVEEKFPLDLPFMQQNRELRIRVERMEKRGREHGLLVDDETRFRFFDSRIPSDVHNVALFESWRRQAERRDPSILLMTEADLLREAGDALDLADYPDRFETGGIPIMLRYNHDPGETNDGVTARVPLEVLGSLDAARFEWLVPGLLADKIEGLIRSLPRRTRTRFMPIHETAQDAAEHLPFGEGSLHVRLAQYLEAIEGIPVDPSLFRLEMLEPHQLMRFELVDSNGNVLEETRHFEDLLEGHRQSAREAFEEVVESETNDDDVAGQLSRLRNRREWDFQPLPRTVSVNRNGRSMNGYPALSDEGDSVRVRVNDDAVTAEIMHEAGVRRLLAMQVSDALRHHLDYLGGTQELAQSFSVSPMVLEGALGDLAVRIASEDVGVLADVRDREAFLELDDALRHGLWPSLEKSLALLEPIVHERSRIAELLNSPMPAGWQSVVDDEHRHLKELVGVEMASTVAPRWLKRIPLYLKAIELRLEKLRGGGEGRDSQSRDELEGWIHLFRTRQMSFQKLGRIDPRLEEFRWMIEEYRVALFAQELCTTERMSSRRLRSVWEELIRT